MMNPNSPLHIISHNDLDGVVAAALAWRAAYGALSPRVSMVGYGEVDNLVLESLRARQELVVIDLFCQRRETIDEIDALFVPGSPPFLFDHHKTTQDRYANRPWAVVDTGYCGAKVYWNWLAANGAGERVRSMADIVEVANDRDLWIGENPDGRLWHGLVTLCGPTGVFTRLALDPRAELSPEERAAAESFVRLQEERFSRAREAMIESRAARGALRVAFLGDGHLEFGDVSDFCGLILDHDDDPPDLAAVAAKRAAGDWAVSMRSRGGLAGRVVALLKDGKKVRGGGHGDAAALYFPSHYREDQIRESIMAAAAAESAKSEETGVTLGDLFKGRV